MARGWESKSIEAQQSEAEAGERSKSGRRRMRPEEAANARERETLRLSRERILQQLAANPNPPYRELLEKTLDDLDSKLADFRG